MDIKAYVYEYARKKKYYGLSCSAEVVHSLIKSDKEFAFSNQEHFEDSEYLAYNIESCIKSYVLIDLTQQVTISCNSPKYRTASMR